MYVALSDLQGKLPADIFTAVSSEVWARIAADVAGEIDGRLAQRYPVPLSPVPALVATAAQVLAAEAVYQQRGYYGDANPWTARANGIRGTLGQQGGQAGLLDQVASGEAPLYAAAPQASKRPAVAITEPAITTSSRGHRLC